MENITELVAAGVSVMGLCGTIFYYAVLRPLESAIEDLRGLINDIRHDLQADEEKRHLMDVRLAKVESSAASAHHRIDTLEGRLNE